MITTIVNFSNWLWKAFLYLIYRFANIMIDTFNQTVKLISDLASSAVALLPDYTVPNPGSFIVHSDFLSALNWVLPISFFIDCLAMMVFAYATYTVLSPALRWAKLLR